MTWLHVVVIVPFIVALVVPFLYQYMPRIHTGWFVISIPTLLFLYFASQLSDISAGQTMMHTVAWIPAIDIHFTVYLDGLSLLFALIITGIGALVVLYSIFYLSKEREALHNFYVYLLMFMGAMLGVVLCDNVMVLYVFWELTSISSFLLIAYWFQRERSRYGAQKSLLITVFGGFAMLAGFLIIYVITGTFSLREMITFADVIVSDVLFIPAALLILLGAFTKSAQFPFHIWLPDAMEAPTPISAYLHSATMVKAGIYLVARFAPIFGSSVPWFWLVVSCGVVTMLWGSFLAMKQTDLKALLAYSTISQLGLIMSLLGLGSAAFQPQYSEYAVILAGALLAAVFHLINHSAFKGTLFMVIGILDHETGTRDIRKLGGLMTIMPVSFTLSIIGGLSMAGLPPFGGFISKEMFFEGVLNAHRYMEGSFVWLAILVWIGSIFTFIYSCLLIFKTFTGKYDPKLLEKAPREASPGMLISPIVLGLVVIILFFFPNVLSKSILEPTMQAIAPFIEQPTVQLHNWPVWSTELLMTIGVVLFGTLLYVSIRRWHETVYNNLPLQLTINHWYDASLALSEKMANRLTRTYMTGFIRHYFIYMFAFVVIVLGSALWLLHGFKFDMSTDAPIGIYEWLLAAGIVSAALAVVFARHRLAAIIALGALGFIISLFFVILRAPDLALTQLVVETISTALFVLCFYYLPRLKKPLQRLPLNLTKLFISIAVGGTLTIVALSAHAHRLGEPISAYFENAFDLAGARNIVNAILVDFRGFDTMLEILVLFIAGIGIYTLNVWRRSKGREQ